MNFDLLQYLFTLGILYIYGRSILHYGLIFIHFMLDQEMVWKSKFEKPRILFLLTGIVFMHLMIYAQQTLKTENHLLRGIIISVFALALFLSHKAWTNNFENNLRKQKKAEAQQHDKNFNLNISEIQIQRLYNELVKYDLLWSDRTSFIDFKNVLTQNWEDHDSKIQFNMDGPTCREFYEYLAKITPYNSLTLKSFFVSSKLVLRPDGKNYKYNTIKNAPTRTPVSKHNETLINIFKKLN